MNKGTNLGKYQKFRIKSDKNSIKNIRFYSTKY